MKCQFGYINEQDYSLIKLNDDFESNSFTVDNETFVSVLPSEQDTTMVVYAKCVDQRDQVGVFTQQVQLQVIDLNREV